MNRIPRNFNRIEGKMLINTNVSKPGDILHITKNLNGYLGYNTRTGKHCYIFASMIRNDSIFKITAVI